MTIKLKTLCLTLAFAVAAAGSASASVVTTINGASQVTKVAADHAVDNYAGAATLGLWGHQNLPAALRAGLIQWDVSSIASTAILESVTMRLYVADNPSQWGGSTRLGVQQLTQSWDEAANWDTYDGTNNWTTGGGDVSATISATYGDIAAGAGAAGTAGYINTWIDFDITTLAQGWVDGSIANNGIRVSAIDIPGDGSSAFGNLSFVADGAADNPQLVITAVPEPASFAALLGLSVGAVVLKRKRKRS